MANKKAPKKAAKKDAKPTPVHREPVQEQERQKPAPAKAPVGEVSGQFGHPGTNEPAMPDYDNASPDDNKKDPTQQ